MKHRDTLNIGISISTSCPSLARARTTPKYQLKAPHHATGPNATSANEGTDSTKSQQTWIMILSHMPTPRQALSALLTVALEDGDAVEPVNGGGHELLEATTGGAKIAMAMLPNHIPNLTSSSIPVSLHHSPILQARFLAPKSEDQP